MVGSIKAGCIPVISDRTPWDGLEENNIGRTIPLEEEFRYHDSIKSHAEKDLATFSQISIKARRYILSPEKLEYSIIMNKKIFDTLFDQQAINND